MNLFMADSPGARGTDESIAGRAREGEK